MAFGDFAITPSTTVTLCAGVPLVKGSEDTLYFGSAGAQASTIASYKIATFAECTYQRNTRNVIRVGMPMGTSGANSALRANYVIFNNTAFEGKNIYAFVNSVDYVNNNTIDIDFTIDPMQTFMFDYELKECYVEREHSSTDVFGDNLVPENFGSFDTVVHHKDDYYRFTGNGRNNKYACVIYFIANKGMYQDPSTLEWMEDPSQYSVSGRYANNVYIGAGARIIAAGTPASGIDVEIEDIMQQGGSIVNIQMIPQSIIDATDSGDGIVKQGGQFLQNNSFISGSETYYPKNKKLLTYPFCYLTVSNNSGDERQYRWEYFGNANAGGLRIAEFKMYGGYQPSPQCSLVPQDYKGIGNNYGEAVAYDAFPSSAWSEDSYLQWKLRNGNSYNTSMSNTVVSGITSVASGALAGAAVGAMGGGVGAIPGAMIGAMGGLISTGQKLESLTASMKDAQATPDKLCGNASSVIVNELIGNTGFTIYSMQIPNAVAKTIDDYFTMYGYATHRLKVPNRNVRPHWTYTKTQGCTVYGNIPSEFAREIQERYNNGVRFWNSAAEVGNYSLDNSV